MIGLHLGLVVEGPGDANAVPLLLEQLATAGEFDVPDLGKPIAVNGRGQAIKKGGLEGFVAVAAARPRCGAVLVLLDGEGDAVCELGPELLRRAQSVTDKPVLVALADPLYESWLVASAESMGLEKVTYNGAKSDPVGAIKRSLGSRKYTKPVWQPRLTTRMDIDQATKRSHSLNRLAERMAALVAP